MVQLNRILRLSALISGNFDGEKIIKTKFQHFIHLLAIFLMSFECLKAFTAAFKPEIRFYLSVLYLIGDSRIQRIWTVCFSLVQLGFVINHIYYYKFNSNPKKIRSLNYLFCNEIKLKLNYKFSKIVIKKVMDMIELKKYGLIFLMRYPFPYSYIFVSQCHIIRTILLAYFDTHRENGITKLTFILLSVPTSLILDLVLIFESFTIFSTYLIFIANCQFIAYRIEEINRKLKIIIKSIQNGKSRSINLERKIQRISNEMNSILRFHKDTQYLADISIVGFYICVLFIALFFPFMMLFGKISFIYQIVLFLTYCITMAGTSYPIIWANILVFEKFEEYRNMKFSFLRYSNNVKTKIKLLYFGAKSENEMNFNCFGLFKYKNEFLLHWILESAAITFLIYAATNI